MQAKHGARIGAVSFFALALALLAAGSTACAAQVFPDADLLTVDQRISSAFVAGDLVYLQAHIAPDFRFTHGLLEGNSEDRATVLSNAARRPPFYIRRETSAAVAEIHGDTGLVMGRLSAARGPLLNDADQRPRCLVINFVHLYRRHHRTWQWVSHRTAQVITPPAPC